MDMKELGEKGAETEIEMERGGQRTRGETDRDAHRGEEIRERANRRD